MSITAKLNIFHLIYLRSKYIFLAVFTLLVSLAFASSDSVYGSGVVDTVETKIKLINQDETRFIRTTQNTLKSALDEAGFVLSENSITDPSVDTRLSGTDITVRVVPALPVLIADGNQHWIGKSAYNDPLDILSQLKVDIAPEDVISSELIMDPVEFGIVGQKVSIKRAPTFTIIADGEEKVVHSWAETISGVLADEGYVLRQNDIVEPVKEASSLGVNVIEITRINYEDIEETVVIEYKNITQTDYNMYKGQSRVAQNGVNGSKRQSVHIVYENNIEVSRTVTSAEILISPINKITIVGVKPYGIDDLWPIIVRASQKYDPVSGVDVSPEKMARVMWCESKYRADAYNPQGYYGLFQWGGGLYNYASLAGYPASNMFDVNAQIFATAYRAAKEGWGAWGACSGA